MRKIVERLPIAIQAMKLVLIVLAALVLIKLLFAIQLPRHFR